MPRGIEQEAFISDEHLSTIRGKISKVAKVLQCLDCPSFPGSLSTQVISNNRTLGHQVIWAPMLFLNPSPLPQELHTAQSSFPAATLFFNQIHLVSMALYLPARGDTMTSPHLSQEPGSFSCRKYSTLCPSTPKKPQPKATQQCWWCNSHCPAALVGKRAPP